ncbi:hypothetical protein C4D60_Mb09t06350 [Musa balbisiana]|uniref:F-ATPase gamma subunit n=1 Tax=Musa balbisiana TaxID=52838 RepID=A0A4S8IGU7_MUSBA|nr:hypothetical protein C4D60_Mb09t06350 [Musa balbisiana]
MAMAALRREGRRLLLSPVSYNSSVAARSAILSDSELGPMGARSISTQAVRNRMKSVKNIQKITKAMKMVAASKLRAVQVRTENSRGFWQPFTALLGDNPSVDVKKNVIVTITSDKGLCGGINSTSVKVSKALYKLTSGPEKETKYVVLGEKGKVQLVRDSKNSIEMNVTELQKNPLNYTQVSVLADDILKNMEYDALRIIYNKFQSVVSFLPTVSTILSPETVEKESEAGGKLGSLDSYEIEGGDTKAEVLQNLAEFQFSCSARAIDNIQYRRYACMIELQRTFGDNMVALQESHSIFVKEDGSLFWNAATAPTTPLSPVNSERMEILVHSNSTPLHLQTRVNTCSSPISHSSEADEELSPTLQVHVNCQNDPHCTRFSSPYSMLSPVQSPPVDIKLNFKASPSCPRSNLDIQRSCFSPFLFVGASPSAPIEPQENGQTRLLPVHANETEFVEQDENGRLWWTEVDELHEERNRMGSHGAASDLTQAMGGRSPRLHLSTEPCLLPQIRFALETNGSNLQGEITVEEIEKAIMSSALMNKISLSHEDAKECAQLIVEELDGGHGAFEPLKQEDNLAKTSAHPGWSPSRPTSSSGGLTMSRIDLFLRTHWRRAWVVLLWLAACIALFAWKFVQYRHRLAFEVMGYCLCTAKGAAETLKLNMALVLLPVCRNTMTWLRRSRRINSVVPFNDTINFHKLVAGGIVIGIILHGGTHLTCDFPRIANADRLVFRQTIAYCFQYRQPSYVQIVLTTEGATGIAMVVLMIVAFLLATRPSRRSPASLPRPIGRWAGFNAFWYSHHLLILVYVLLVIHSMFLFLTHDVTEKTTWMYIAIPVLIYAGERMFRTIRSEIYNVEVVKATIYPGKVLSLKLMKPAGFTFRSGMHIYVQCPEISRFEWHPFSLTSAPEDDHLGLHIRSLGDWSCQIYNLFQEALLSGKPDLPQVSIDGPYGAASQDHAKYKIILLVGLGIGATPFISILKDIANGLRRPPPPEDNVGDANGRRTGSGPEKAYFYWVTREQGSFEWFRDIMKEVSVLNKKQGVIEMHNYLTSVFEEGDKRSAMVRAVQALHFMKTDVDIISKTPVRTKFARPNWSRVLSGLAGRHGGKRIGVFYCGPAALGRDLERLCHEMSVKTSTRFVFHKEHY